MLKFFYSFFLGLLLLIFVAMGIASFYAGPQAPSYPPVAIGGNAPTPTEQKQIDETYRRQSDAFATKYQPYQRNVSIIALVAALLLLVLSLALHSRVSILADGMLVGSTLTLIYSIIRSFGSESPRYSFVVVSVGIALTLLVGYLKFVKPANGPAKKST